MKRLEINQRVIGRSELENQLSLCNKFLFSPVNIYFNVTKYFSHCFIALLTIVDIEPFLKHNIKSR
jgi:hypothetical protein